MCKKYATGWENMPKAVNVWKSISKAKVFGSIFLWGGGLKALLVQYSAVKNGYMTVNTKRQPCNRILDELFKPVFLWSNPEQSKNPKGGVKKLLRITTKCEISNILNWIGFWTFSSLYLGWPKDEHKVQTGNSYQLISSEWDVWNVIPLSDW